MIRSIATIVSLLSRLGALDLLGEILGGGRYEDLLPGTIGVDVDVNVDVDVDDLSGIRTGRPGIRRFKAGNV